MYESAADKAVVRRNVGVQRSTTVTVQLSAVSMLRGTTLPQFDNFANSSFSKMHTFFSMAARDGASG